MFFLSESFELREKRCLMLVRNKYMNHQTAAVAILCCANRTRRKTAEWAGGKCTIILSKGWTQCLPFVPHKHAKGMLSWNAPWNANFFAQEIWWCSFFLSFFLNYFSFKPMQGIQRACFSEDNAFCVPLVNYLFTSLQLTPKALSV